MMKRMSALSGLLVLSLGCDAGATATSAGSGTLSDAGPSGDATIAAGDAPTDGPLAATQFAVSSAGAELWIRAVGGRDGGPAIVAINGGPGFSHDYLVAFEGLASEGVRVVTYDQRGTGRSTISAGATFAMADYTADLDAIRAALGVPAIHVLGHSFGGLVAEFYTAAFPARVASLTLVDATPADGLAALAGIQRLDARFAALTASGVLPNPLPANVGDDCGPSVRATFPAYNADPAFVMPASLLATTCRASTAGATNAALQSGWDLNPSLATYANPVHVVFGAQDPFGTAWRDAEAVTFAAAAPTVTTVDGAGHYPWFEKPSATEDAVRAFYRARAGLAL